MSLLVNQTAPAVTDRDFEILHMPFVPQPRDN